MLTLPRAVAILLGISAVAISPGCSAPDAREALPDSTSVHRLPIIKGEVSQAADNAVILIGVKVESGKIIQSCSGTMVAKNLVLTARHCVGDVAEDGTTTSYPAAALAIYVGADASRKIDGGNTPSAIGKTLFTPPGTYLLPDVALILLDKSIDAPIAPIRLTGGAKKGEALTIVGFGIDEKNETPASRKMRTGLSVLEVGPAKMTHFDIDEGEFVFGEAACAGDSGGPALSSKTKAVVGVASRVSNGKDRTEANPSGFCVGTGTEDVYTDLSAVGDVITKAFKAAGADPVIESTEAAKSTKPSKDEEVEEDAKAPTAPTRTLTQTSSGCRAAAVPASQSSHAWAALGVALAALITRRRRA